MGNGQNPSGSRSTDRPAEFLREHRGRETETGRAAVEFPFAEIRHIGKHGPQQRYGRSICHLREDMEGIDERQIVTRYEDESEEDTRHDRGHDIDHLVAEPFGQRLGGRQRHDEGHRTEDVEELDVLRIMDIILEIIRDGGILHGEHDERHDTDTGEDDPGLVHEEVLEVLDHVAVLLLGLRHTLPGREERDEEEGDTQDAEEAHRILVSLRLIDHAVVADRAEPFNEV